MWKLGLAKLVVGGVIAVLPGLIAIGLLGLIEQFGPYLWPELANGFAWYTGHKVLGITIASPYLFSAIVVVSVCLSLYLWAAAMSVNAPNEVPRGGMGAGGDLRVVDRAYDDVQFFAARNVAWSALVSHREDDFSRGTAGFLSVGTKPTRHGPLSSSADYRLVLLPPYPCRVVRLPLRPPRHGAGDHRAGRRPSVGPRACVPRRPVPLAADRPALEGVS